MPTSKPAPGDKHLRAALDATPLLGARTGVGEFCAGALGALARRPEVEVGAYAVSWRLRHRLAGQLPAGVRLLDRPMPARPLNFAWSHFSLPPAELFVGAVDVVHGTNFVAPPARRAARVLTVHDLTTVHFPEMCQPATLAFPRLVRRALEQGAWAHTPSAFVAREVVDLFGASPSRVRVVHHGLTAPLAISGAAPRPVALPGWAHQYILAIGTVEPRKDYPTLVRAFGRFATAVPGLALVIAGPDGWGAGELDEAVASCPARRQVVRLGWVDAATRDELLTGATVLAYPSRYEGFGFPPLQAMAVGVPVVATRCGALVEVLGDAARFVEVGDADGLALALQEMTGDDEARQSWARNGRQRAALFTWEACAEGLSALYRDAVASHG